MGGSVRAGDDRLRLEFEQLCAAVTDAVDHLADLDAEDDLEEFGSMLDALIATAGRLRPSAGAWGESLEAALGRLHEAHDLLDDGEPSDAVAFEVMAARDLLRRRLGG